MIDREDLIFLALATNMDACPAKIYEMLAKISGQGVLRIQKLTNSGQHEMTPPPGISFLDVEQN